MKELKISAEIYSDKSLQAAREAYRNLTTIEIIPDGEKRILRFQNSRYGDERTMRSKAGSGPITEA